MCMCDYNMRFRDLGEEAAMVSRHHYGMCKRNTNRRAANFKTHSADCVNATLVASADGHTHGTSAHGLTVAGMWYLLYTTAHGLARRDGGHIKRWRPDHIRYTAYSTSRRSSMFSSKGLVLKTFISCEPASGRPVLKRTYLFSNSIFEQQICHYVPPLFLLLHYESSAFMRFDSNATYECAAWCRTDVTLKENENIVKNLLELADCLPVSFQLSFLRFDNIGSLQSRVNVLPLPAVSVGCLVRLEFDNMQKRNRAMNVLYFNRLANSDVYSINRDANSCITMVSRYMEALFQHALKVEASWCPDNTQLKKDGSSVSGEAADADGCVFEDNDMFTINFRVHEIEGGGQTEKTASNGGTRRQKVEIIRPGPSRMETSLRERSSVASTLTVHDVNEFFELPFFVGDTNAVSQLEETPVVNVRYENDFVVLACCAKYRSSLVTMHIYYCWDESVAKILGTLADQSQSDTTKVCVNLVTDLAEAVYQLVKDANGSFWKENFNTFIRLVTSSQADADAYSKHVLWPILVDRGNSESSAMLRMELDSLTVDGYPNLFRSGIDLDCQKVCRFGDARSCAFVKTYDSLMRDPSMRPNYYGTSRGRVNVGQLRSRQTKYENLLLTFKRERIVAKVHRMASELFCGILDVFGLGDERWAGHAPDRVANMFFLSTLIDKSEFYSSSTNMVDLFQSVRKNYKTSVADKTAADGGSLLIPKPTFTAVEPALYVSAEGKTMCELDMESAYPTIIVKYNISPETTVIVRSSEYHALERTIAAQTFKPDFKMSDWFYVVDHVFGDLRILSVKREILQGCLARIMEKMILKRRSHQNVSILSDFYKTTANRMYGNTGARGSDMYALHCTSSVTSICKSLMSNLLHLLGGHVLMQQVDGALVKALNIADLQSAVQDAARAVVGEDMNVRFKEVDSCIVLSANKYVLRYANGNIKMVGQQGSSTISHTAQEIVESSVKSVLKEFFNHEDYHQPDLRCNVLIRMLLDRLLDNVKSRERSDHSECYYMDVRPYVDTHYNVEEKIRLDNHVRLGNTVAVWPIIKRDGDTLFKVLATEPPVFGDRVKVDKFTVLRPLINAWARDLCTVFCCDTEETERQRGYSVTFMTMFKEYNNMYITKLFGIET